jgi:hypothetical protein
MLTFWNPEEKLAVQKKREDEVLCEGCDEYCDEGVMIYSCRECT